MVGVEDWMDLVCVARLLCGCVGVVGVGGALVVLCCCVIVVRLGSTVVQ